MNAVLKFILKLRSLVRQMELYQRDHQANVIE